jgi:hypothetical protein
MRFIFSTLLLASVLAYGQQAYFQQESNYTINVTLNDKLHTLEGDIEIEYKNNSNESLNFIWMHLWPNAYKDNTTALVQQSLRSNDYKLYYADSTDRGFIDKIDFKVNDSKVKWEYHPEHIDIAKVFLASPLGPGESIVISTPFRVKVPKGIYSRLGHIGESYQISQWYPKPAVYDKDGWHEMPYLSQGEFYSEYGSFDVSITVPKNYVVGATGDLQNKEEVEWLLKKAHKDSAYINSLREKDMASKSKDMSFPKSNEETKTLRYIQNNVHDFAWFADKRFYVLKGEVELPDSKRKVDTWTMFTNNEIDLWKNSIEYMNDAIYYYSLWNGDYPYQHATAVDGSISAGGGMEYPNVTVIGESGTALLLETVIVHEVGHNWFYGILGSNERDNAWMDEGLNTLNENRYLEKKYPNKTMLESFLGNRGSGITNALHLNDLKNKAQHDLSYLISVRNNADQPMQHPSADYTGLNYGGIVYSKTGVVFTYLKAYLGEELFDKCMHDYYENWKFKHPQPENLKASFEKVTGMNFDWFFEDIVKTTKIIDFKIQRAKEGEFKNDNIYVANKGDINGPFCIAGVKNDTVVQLKWFDSIPSKGYVTFPQGDYDKYMIDPYWQIPEYTRTNNSLKLNGLAKRTEELDIQILGTLENPDKSFVFWMPTMGWNKNDGLMLGAAFYNKFIPKKKFEYLINPMYAINSGSLTGFGQLQWNFKTSTSNLFQKANLKLNAQSFTESFDKDNENTLLNEKYLKVAPELNLTFKRRSLLTSPTHGIKLRQILIYSDTNFSKNSLGFGHIGNSYSEGSYFFNLKRPFHSLDIKATGTYKHPVLGQNEGTMLEFEVNESVRYLKSGKRINLRGFVGKMFLENEFSEGFALYGNGQSGSTFFGTRDFKYDYLMLDRSPTAYDMLAQQQVNSHGAMKTRFNAASNDLMLALNMEIELPLPLNATLFGDFLAYQSSLNSKKTQMEQVFNAGLKLSLIPRLVDVYIPLLYSDIIDTYNQIQNISFLRSLRFTFNLQQLNPYKLMEQAF